MVGSGSDTRCYVPDIYSLYPQFTLQIRIQELGILGREGRGFEKESRRPGFRYSTPLAHAGASGTYTTLSQQVIGPTGSRVAGIGLPESTSFPGLGVGVR